MKILTITANYPPFHGGGYELRVKDIMDGLAARGHQITVVSTKPTQKLGSDQDQNIYPVKRILHNRLTAKFFPKEVLFDFLDTKILEKTIEEFKPDLVYLGHTYILSKALLPYLAGCSIPLVYDEGGNGLKGAWTERGRWYQFTGDYLSRYNILNWLKPLVIKLILKIGKGRIKPTWSWPKDMQVFFNSELNKQNALANGVQLQSPLVIRSGINLEHFQFKPRVALSDSLRIIIPGRIEARKGQLDGVRLLNKLKENRIDAELVIIGLCSSADYYQEMISEIDRYQLKDSLQFVPMMDHQDLVSQYHASDICFFSSYHRSGFSRIPLEAMASGCVVISYGYEGSDEIIRHGENGFLVHEGDISRIVDIIKQLKESESGVERILSNARQCIEKEHAMDCYIGQIENIITQLGK